MGEHIISDEFSKEKSELSKAGMSLVLIAAICEKKEGKCDGNPGYTINLYCKCRNKKKLLFTNNVKLLLLICYYF